MIDLTAFDLVLASGSPRRRMLLTEMGWDFRTVTVDLEEDYPLELQAESIPRYLCEQKSLACDPDELRRNSILITADTIVWSEGKELGKPADAMEAVEMLMTLSGKEHQVMTAVCLARGEQRHIFHEVTDVVFDVLTPAMISYYVEHYQPMDKAGAYGIQEWIGHVGIVSINGSYNNVVGLPTHALYREMSVVANATT